MFIPFLRTSTRLQKLINTMKISKDDIQNKAYSYHAYQRAKKFINQSFMYSLKYIQTSIRETTPFVTEIVSPPRGYPTTVTESCPQNATS